jgi:hypothetical protein
MNETKKGRKEGAGRTGKREGRGGREAREAREARKGSGHPHSSFPFPHRSSPYLLCDYLVPSPTTSIQIHI